MAARETVPAMRERGPVLATVRRWLPRLLGVALFVWVIAAVGPVSIWRSLRAANPWLVAPAVLAALPFIAVKGWRWARILDGLGSPVSWGEAVRLYAIGIWAGQATVGQAGDFVKAWYLRSRGIALSRALLSALLDRLFDLAALFALGALGLFAFAGGGQSLVLAIGALTAVCLALAAALTARWRAPLFALLGQFVPGVVRRRLAGNTTVQSLVTARLDARHLAPVLGLTLLSWIISLGRVVLCFWAVGVRLALPEFLIVAALTTLAGLISIGGIGTRDVALVALLAPYGYDRGQAVAASFLILVLNISNIVPGFLAWLREPLPLRRASAGTFTEAAPDGRES